MNQLYNDIKNEMHDFEEGDLKRLFDHEYVPVMDKHSLNDDYAEQEDQEIQRNYDSGQLDEITDINEESQITMVPEAFENTEMDQITVPLQPTRTGCERRHHNIYKITLSNLFYFTRAAI